MADEQLIQLRHIASQTLGFARSSTSAKPICLVVLTEAALRVHHRAIEQKRIHIVRQLPERLQVSVYRGELLQAVSNLIVNAVEALEKGGTLCLRLRKCGEAACLTIADNGHGISPQQTPSIFEPFFSTKGEQGNGLGLALTRKIIDHHQGSIRMRSSVQPNRRGTSFRVRIPA
ncbi:MAG: sensor histidine kinase [Janthinobacterium lividum]